MNPYFNILIIDDDQDDHDIFRAATREIKIVGQRISEIVRISSAYSGIEALERLKVQEQLPDFIVLDLNMPVMDGFAFLEETSKNQRLKGIPIYVLTTSRDQGHRRICEAYSSCAGFFTKPSTKNEVRAIVEQMLLVHTV